MQPPAGDGPPPEGDLWASMGPHDIVALLDQLTDGMFVFDASWRFRFVNEPAATMLGHTREELLGAHAWTVFPEAVGGPSYLAYHEAQRERRPVQCSEFYEPLGREFEIRIYPVEDDDLAVLFRDVTEVRRAEGEVQEMAAQLSEAEQIAGFGVWRWELASDSVRWSAELHRIYGVQPGGFAGTVEDFVRRLHPDDRDVVAGHIAEAIATLEPFAFEERILRPDGSERRLMSQGHVIAGPGGEAAMLVGVCHDVTERLRAERALGRSERRMREIIDNSPSVIAVKDLEGRYLMANDVAGRLVDRSVEEMIGELCTDLFPPDVGAQVRAHDEAAVEQGRPVFGEIVLQRDGEPRTFVTVTFALPDEDGTPIEVCTIATDVTEQRAGESERQARISWQERIASALAEGRMVVHAQPIVDLASGATTAHELLVRMCSEDDPSVLLAPGDFLPAAERYGLIQSIDAWVVGQALGLADMGTLEVNLSAVTLSDPEARREIVALLRAKPESARNVVFEITETAATRHLEAAVAFADEITALGCGLALDDFGTGFGSFTYLRRLPLRVLKIDRTFVTDLATSIDDRRVVQSIIGIAEHFGLGTIAEGVEDEETLYLLRSMGAGFAQGFHLGRPAPL